MKLPAFTRSFWLGGLLVVLVGVTAGYVAWSIWPSRSISIPQPDSAGAKPRVIAEVQALREAVRQNPSSDTAWGQLGMMLMAHQWNQEAYSCFRTATRLNPREGRWLYYAAVVQERTDPELALSAFAQAAAIRPDYVPLRYRWGLTQLRLNKLNEAAEQFRRMSELAPQLPHGDIGLGRVSSGTGDLKTAMRHFERALALDPENREARIELERLRFQLGIAPPPGRGLPPQAGSSAASIQSIPDPWLEEVGQLEISPRYYANQADQFLAQGNISRAAAAYRQLIEDHPELSRPRLNLATILLNQGDIQGATAIYQDTVQKFPEDPLTHYSLAMALQAAGDIEGAISAYRDCIRLKSDYAQAHFALGLLLEQKQMIPEAIESYRNAVQSDPRLAPAQLALGVALQKTGKVDDGIPHIRSAVELAPNDPVPRQFLERALAEQKGSKPSGEREG